MKDRDMDDWNRPGLSLATPAQPADIGLFLELGTQGRKEIARLKRGTGVLTREVQVAIDRWRAQLGIAAAAEVVPVVLLYRRAEPGYIAEPRPAVPEDPYR